jgi:hypothetical protein
MFWPAPDIRVGPWEIRAEIHGNTGNGTTQIVLAAAMVHTLQTKTPK